MDQSRALHRLLESADLLGMVEEMTSPGMAERLSPSSWAGLRITLRNARDAILASHDVFASDLVSRAKAKQESIEPLSQTTSSAGTSSSEASKDGAGRIDSVQSQSAALSHEAQRLQIKRRDLRTSVEKMIER